MVKVGWKEILFALMFFSVLLIGPVPGFCAQQKEAAMMQSIRKHIEQNVFLPAKQVRLEYLSEMPNLNDILGKITFRIESKPREEFIGDTSFNVRIFVNDIFLKKEPVRVRIEQLRDFVVSINSIAKGTVLSTNDVTVQRKWVRSFPINSISDLDDVMGKSIVVGIRPNTQITQSMLRVVTPVKKGKLVQVILDSGAIKMMMNAIAEEDGTEDSVVKIRNLNSNKIIYARVIGQSKVQVDF